MPRVVHFEIHADDPERAMQFYSDLFGWQFPLYMPGYWGVVTGEEGTPGINGGLLQRPAPAAPMGAGLTAYPCTLQIDSDIDGYMERVVAAGGGIALPKHAIPGMAWQAYCLDTEGNVFGLHQPDPSAA